MISFWLCSWIQMLLVSKQHKSLRFNCSARFSFPSDMLLLWSPFIFWTGKLNAEQSTNGMPQMLVELAQSMERWLSFQLGWAQFQLKCYKLVWNSSLCSTSFLRKPCQEMRDKECTSKLKHPWLVVCYLTGHARLEHVRCSYVWLLPHCVFSFVMTCIQFVEQ